MRFLLTWWQRAAAIAAVLVGLVVLVIGGDWPLLIRSAGNGVLVFGTLIVVGDLVYALTRGRRRANPLIARRQPMRPPVSPT